MGVVRAVGVVMVVIVMVVIVVMVVVGSVTMIVGVDRELGRRHTRAQHAIRMHVHVRDRQAAEGVLQRVERQAGVQQRAERHVARNAREAIEVQHLHQLPDSLKLQYRVSPRITWSTTRISISAPAATSRRVSSTSSGLGVGSPEGWL